jgi:hypothetical protein
MFYGPGIDNFDLTIQKKLPFNDARSLDLRLEAFNAFNHTQFYSPAAVDRQIRRSELWQYRHRRSPPPDSIRGEI